MASWDKLQKKLAGLQGRTLAIAALLWFLLLFAGLFCLLSGYILPQAEENAPLTAQQQAVVPTVSVPPNAAASTATLPAQTITIPTPTPLPPDATPVTDPNALPPLPWGEFGYGIAAQMVIPVVGDYSYTPRQIHDMLGFNWVKQQMRWRDIYPQRGEAHWELYDPAIQVAHEMGLKVMLSVVDAPLWARDYVDDDPLGAPPADLQLFADFLGELVERYPGQIQAIEVWNEENLNREWDTADGLNPERYVEMLRLAYQAIKSRDPNIIVISGALSPTGVTQEDPNKPGRLLYMDDYAYLQRMIDAGFLDYVDCVGAHHNGINMPPDVGWNEGYNDPTAQFRGPFDSPHHSWSFKSTLWDYHAMIQAAGYSTPLCVTEFGWASAEGWTQVPPGFEFAWDNTLQEQAEWDVEAFQLMRQWGFVRLAFLWNLDYAQKGGMGETDPNAPYSILDFNGAPRPAFDALSRMPKIP